MANRWIRALFANARRQSGDACLKEAENFRALGKRLAPLGSLHHPRVLEELDAKAAFMSTRASMRIAPLRAASIMMNEWRTGNYRRYALGKKQVLVDAAAVDYESVRPAVKSERTKIR